MVDLPKAVHRVVSRGREYFYFQIGRGTLHAGPRIRLPDDPHSPEFWQAIRTAQGVINVVPVDTVGAVIDAYLISPALTENITKGTREVYERELEVARSAWGKLPAAGLRPMHVQALMDGLAAKPGKANNFLGTMRALSKWARTRGDPFGQSITEGVSPYPTKDGHKPWTPEQIRCAHESLTGHVRRGVMLALYTGQRVSDVVRLGWTDVDDGGFRIRQRKTGREIWCPIVSELSAEMVRWEKRPSPFVTQDDGSVYAAKLFSKHYAEARAGQPALAGTTLHGLRSTAVIRLRQAGLSTGQIGDIIGMSLAMIERYCRFADRKAGGQAALLTLERTSAERNCKTVGKLDSAKRGESSS